MSSEVLPEPDVARIQQYCAERVPERDRHRIRVECEVAHQYLTIVEYRAPWDPSTGAQWSRTPIARLEYTEATGTWQLYHRDRSGRFQQHLRTPPSMTVENLIAEIDRDPTRSFWCWS